MMFVISTTFFSLFFFFLYPLFFMFILFFLTVLRYSSSYLVLDLLFSHFIFKSTDSSLSPLLFPAFLLLIPRVSLLYFG